MKTPYKILLSAIVLFGIAAASGPVIQRLRDLYDVKFGTLNNGQILQYNATSARWTNAPAPAGTGDMTQAAYDADADGVVDLGAGGTGSALSDPGADRLLFWDDSAGSNDWLTIGSGLTVTGTEIAATGGGATPTNFPNATVTNTFAALGNATVGGQVLVADGSASLPAINFGSSGYGPYRAGNVINLAIASTLRHQMGQNYYNILMSTAEYRLNETTVLATDGADTLAQRRATAAQTNRIYGTWTDASNYKRLALYHNGTTATVAAESAGTGGADQNLLLKAQGAGSVIAAGLQVDDDAYDATSWNGNTNVPTKNALRDKIEAMAAGVDHTGIVDFEGTGSISNVLRADIETLNATTQNVDELNLTGDLTVGGAVNSPNWNTGFQIVTNNIQALGGAPADVTIVDLTFANRTATLAGALTFLHATNGADGLVQVLKLRAGGADRALTIPSGWQTNTYSPVPASITNGYLTKIYIETIGTTADAASQTNALVSFEYYKVP